MYSLLCHLLSHIYIIMFDWVFILVFEVFKSVFSFQIYDKISAIHFLIQIHFSKHNPLCAYNHLFLQYKCLFMNVTTAVDSPNTPLSFVILSFVFLATHLNEYGNEIFDDTHTGFSIFVGKIFIINEQNDKTCHFDDDTKGGFYDKHMGLRILI